MAESAVTQKLSQAMRAAAGGLIGFTLGYACGFAEGFLTTGNASYAHSLAMEYGQTGFVFGAALALVTSGWLSWTAGGIFSVLFLMDPLREGDGLTVGVRVGCIAATAGIAALAPKLIPGGRTKPEPFEGPGRPLGGIKEPPAGEPVAPLEPAAPKPETLEPKGPRPESQRQKDLGQQYEEITNAQDRAKSARPKTKGKEADPEWEGVRKRPKQDKIRSTQKSKQRDRRDINDYDSR